MKHSYHGNRATSCYLITMQIVKIDFFSFMKRLRNSPRLLKEYDVIREQAAVL